MAAVPLEFLIFGATLLGVATLHRHTLLVSLLGLATISLFKIVSTGFVEGPGLVGFSLHLRHEAVTLVNLLCLLLGFALLSRHFEKSHFPLLLPKYLPRGWVGAFVMLMVIFALSGFLDNIAAAMIGGAMAHQVFQGRVHIGYLAAIVAAANAGGAGSVLGDTTTTMMWISGVSPLQVLEAYAGAIVALIVFGIPAARAQQAYSPILRHNHEPRDLDWGRLGIVALILLFAMATNIGVNAKFPQFANRFPFIGVAVWVALVLTAGVRRHDWEVLPEAFKGAVFLLALVLCASMMPVERLPSASWLTTLVLGFVSAVFDNIPLTALALKQGGYDWGFLAYAVGFGGSMIWFGSSAGVALASMYPEARSVVRWLRHGWFIAVAYVLGFAVLLVLFGWDPETPRRPTQSNGAAVEIQTPVR